MKSAKKHDFFQGVEWDALLKHEVRAPYIPVIDNVVDSSNFPKSVRDRHK